MTILSLFMQESNNSLHAGGSAAARITLLLTDLRGFRVPCQAQAQDDSPCLVVRQQEWGSLWWWPRPQLVVAQSPGPDTPQQPTCIKRVAKIQTGVENYQGE